MSTMSWLTLVIATHIERLLKSCESGGAKGVVAGPIFLIIGPICSVAGPIYLIIDTQV